MACIVDRNYISGHELGHSSQDFNDDGAMADYVIFDEEMTDMF